MGSENEKVWRESERVKGEWVVRVGSERVRSESGEQEWGVREW